MIKVTAEEYKVITKYIYALTGITLEDNKVYLVETRLGPLVEAHGCASYSEFLYRAKADATKETEREVINAITTQETLFFRDTSPFELLRYKVLPDLIDLKTAQQKGAGKIPIRIWSAACSTGQEAYSTAMVLSEMIPDLHRYDIKIVGTDISDAAVAAASYGRYSRFEIDRGMTSQKLSKYFMPDGEGWRIKDELRILTSFRKFNLFDRFQLLGKFDIIFCRNVAIYFSIEDRKILFNKIADIMHPHSALIIGSSEYLAGICDRFESQRHIKSVYYRLKAAAPTPGTKPPALSSKTSAPADAILKTPVLVSTGTSPARPD